MSTQVTVTALPDCDFDASHGPAYADFKTSFGPWGYGCKGCFDKYGGSLGTGYGQVLVVDDDTPPVPCHGHDVFPDHVCTDLCTDNVVCCGVGS